MRVDYFVVLLELDVDPGPDIEPEEVPVPDVLLGDVLDEDDAPLGDEGDVLDELLVPDGEVDDELPVLGLLIELLPVVEGLVVLLVSVLVVDEELDVAGGVAGVVVVELELLGPGGVTTVLSLRSQAVRPNASATASALDNKILDFMWNSFTCYGDGQRKRNSKTTATPPCPAACTRKFDATRPQTGKSRQTCF